MQEIIDIVKKALKEDLDTEIYITLNGSLIHNKIQLNIPKIFLHQVKTSNNELNQTNKSVLTVDDSGSSNSQHCQIANPCTDDVLIQENDGAKNQNPVQAVLQPFNILGEIKKETDILHLFNRYDSELEKRNSTLLKKDDQQNIINKRYNLSLIQPIPLSDDSNITHRFPLYVLPTPYSNLVKAVAHNLCVPVEAVAPALLCAVYISGRGQFKIQVKPDYFESFTEYFIVVQHSGENKSAIVRFFRSVFEKFNEGL